MKCFYHVDQDAVGACKSCGKGLCTACAVDMTKGLACRGKCENDVQSVIDLIDHNIKLSPIGRSLVQQSKKNSLAGSLFILGAGVIFLLISIAMEKLWDIPGLMGLLFVAYGGYTLWRTSKIPIQMK
jgi:hypothetical protein